ncbi:MAG: penicillin acylase family protein [Candidatus Aminicenantales bacterium]
MKWLKASLSLFAAAAVFWVLNFSHGLIPPLGKFCNPFAGFWQNNNRSHRIVEDMVLPGLEKEVEVVWDSRCVPHIFAANDHDLYFAQGYITARDRLWQMEFQTLALAGRLSEILGSSTLEYDRYMRRIGMVYAAENAVKGLTSDPESLAVIQAYTDGVNAYIKKLKRKKLPLEYKLLDYRPEPWTFLKSALLVKYMAWNLTGFSSDYPMTLLLQKIGEKSMDELFPYHPPFLEPIIPREVKWNFRPQPLPKPEVELIPPLKISATRALSKAGLRPGIGSNNWAVSAELTASGYPLLCNDPHLDLNLPSLWYEVQLVAPGVNVYGVSLPGAPTVIIGFNQDIAWGVTNAGSDVLDWYLIKFRDSSPKEYLYHGQWRKTGIRKEEIKVRGGKTVVETVYYTHHGPVVYVEGEKKFNERVPYNAAMRWTGHDPSNEIASFYRLNRAESYEDYIEAIRTFDCPAQNFIYADRSGNIALWHMGKLPLRWKGQGRYVLDGSLPEAEWQGWIPRENLPHVKNPKRGFVSSANQMPVDSSYPYYLGWDYVSFERGVRVNELLSRMKNITPEDMIRMQLDVVDLRARKVVSSFLKYLKEAELTAEEEGLVRELESWNFEYKPELIAPTIFEQFWREIYRKIWEDEFEESIFNLIGPGGDVTLRLILTQPESPYFDDKKTEAKERLADIVQEAFKTAAEKLVEKYGRMSGAWAWGKTRRTDIVHLAKIPALSWRNLATGGSSRTINAISKSFGPSWRMVVALGPEVRAWGIYPGGESGNPGSKYYDNFIEDWAKGKVYELLYLKSPDEKNPALLGKTRMRGAE